MMLNCFFCLRLLVLFWVCLGIASCASINLSDYAIPEEPPPFLVEKSIAVLPFKGSVPTLDPAGEWFAHKLAMSGKLKVMAPAQVELLLLDKGKSSLLQWESLQEAAVIGQEVGTQVVAIGTINTEKSKMHWNVVCEVMLVDSNNGEVSGPYKGVDMMMDYYDPAIYYMRSANKAAFAIIGAKKK